MSDALDMFVTVEQGGAGWMATLYHWNPEMDGFWEPLNTGFGRYGTKAEAIMEARDWANDLEVEYRPA